MRAGGRSAGGAGESITVLCFLQSYPRGVCSPPAGHCQPTCQRGRVQAHKLKSSMAYFRGEVLVLMQCLACAITGTPSNDPVHIAYVAMNTQSVARTAINSALLHRVDNERMLHIWLVIGKNEKLSDFSLNEVKKWSVNGSCTQLHVLQDEQLANHVSSFLSTTKFKTAHYSTRYAMMKLFIPLLLPSWVPSVIVVDTDMLFLRDVSVLWDLHQSSAKNTPIGMVCQEDAQRVKSYCGAPEDKGLCHPTRYCNSGLIIFNKLQQFKPHATVADFGSSWPKLLTSATQDMVRAHPGKVFAVADQDIFNFLAALYNTRLLWYIPCVWNCDSHTHTAVSMNGRCENQTCATFHAIQVHDDSSSKREGFMQYFWLAYKHLGIGLLRSGTTCYL